MNIQNYFNKIDTLKTGENKFYVLKNRDKYNLKERRVQRNKFILKQRFFQRPKRIYWELPF
jgi:cyanophycinase